MIGKDNYNIRTVDTIKMHENFNRDLITDDMGTFLKNWLRIVIQNPKIALTAYADQTELIWSYNKPANLANMRISDNNLNLESIVLSPVISNKIHRLYEKTTDYSLRWIFWRPAIFMYLAIFFTFMAIKRNNSSAIIVIIPMLLNIFTYLLAIPAPDFRYLYSNLLITPFIILFSFINFSKVE